MSAYHVHGRFRGLEIVWVRPRDPDAVVSCGRWQLPHGLWVAVTVAPAIQQLGKYLKVARTGRAMKPLDGSADWRVRFPRNIFKPDVVILGPHWGPAVTPPPARTPVVKAAPGETQVEESKNKGGSPGEWNWVSLRNQLEKMQEKQTFDTKADFYKWCRANVTPVEGARKRDPAINTVKAAVQKYGLLAFVTISH
jgi:hypothetical protein